MRHVIGGLLADELMKLEGLGSTERRRMGPGPVFEDHLLASFFFRIKLPEGGGEQARRRRQ